MDCFEKGMAAIHQEEARNLAVSRKRRKKAREHIRYECQEEDRQWFNGNALERYY
jgi:hypothetical protein